MESHWARGNFPIECPKPSNYGIKLKAIYVETTTLVNVIKLNEWNKLSKIK